MDSAIAPDRRRNAHLVCRGPGVDSRAAGERPKSSPLMTLHLATSFFMIIKQKKWFKKIKNNRVEFINVFCSGNLTDRIVWVPGFAHQ